MTIPRHDDRGFSLIELMVSVAVIGVLIAVVLPSLLGARSRANDTETTSVLTAVARAQAGWEPLLSGFTDDLARLEAAFPELAFGDGTEGAVHVVVGDVDPGDRGEVLLYARSDSGTWFGLRYVAHGAAAGRHSCSGAESDMTLASCVGTDW